MQSVNKNSGNLKLSSFCYTAVYRWRAQATGQTFSSLETASASLLLLATSTATKVLMTINRFNG